MVYRCAVPGGDVTDAAAQKKKGTKVGRYRIGENVLFYPAFPLDGYIPLSAVRRVWSRKSCVHTTGCCAGGVPVWRLWVRYENGSPEQPVLEYILDTEEQAQRMLELLKERCGNAAFGDPPRPDAGC